MIIQSRVCFIFLKTCLEQISKLNKSINKLDCWETISPLWCSTTVRCFIEGKVTQTTFVLIMTMWCCCDSKIYCNIYSNLFTFRVLYLMFTKSQQLCSQSPPSGINISGKSFMSNWWLPWILGVVIHSTIIWHGTKLLPPKKKNENSEPWVISHEWLWLWCCDCTIITWHWPQWLRLAWTNSVETSQHWLKMRHYTQTNTLIFATLTFPMLANKK